MDATHAPTIDAFQCQKSPPHDPLIFDLKPPPPFPLLSLPSLYPEPVGPQCQGPGVATQAPPLIGWASSSCLPSQEGHGIGSCPSLS
jgi:hypothetical protein